MPEPCLGFAQSASPPGERPFPGNKKNKTVNKTIVEQNHQTIPTIPDNCLRRQLGQPGTTLSRSPGGQPRPAAGSEWDCGREENDKQDKEDKIVGGKREGFQPQRAQRESGKQAKEPVWEVRLSTRAPTSGAREGGVRGIPECRSKDSDAWETGGMSTLKTRKTASRTGTRLGGGWRETTGTVPQRPKNLFRWRLAPFLGGNGDFLGGFLGGRMDFLGSPGACQGSCQGSSPVCLGSCRRRHRRVVHRPTTSFPMIGRKLCLQVRTTSQCPPLSGPTRRMRPDAFSFFKCQ